MKNKTAMFTGHRNIKANLLQLIEKNVKKQLIKLIKINVIYYGNGGARGFDLLAAKCVLELKKEYPHIKLIMVLPCKDQTKKWNNNDIALYNFILSNADKIICISNEYTKRCMLERNDHLIKNSSHCIAYLIQACGGTAYTVMRAKEQGLTVYNIALNM